jgi:hypothetical protein
LQTFFLANATSLWQILLGAGTWDVSRSHLGQHSELDASGPVSICSFFVFFCLSFSFFATLSHPCDAGRRQVLPDLGLKLEDPVDVEQSEFLLTIEDIDDSVRQLDSRVVGAIAHLWQTRPVRLCVGKCFADRAVVRY